MIKKHTNRDKPFEKISELFILIISMAGYVPRNAPVTRKILMAASLAFVLFLNIFHPHNAHLAILYFCVSEVLYLGFITTVLSKNGLHRLFIKKWGENKGYLTYETMAGFLFFHNASSLGFVASAYPGNLFHFMDKGFIILITAILFLGGFLVKIWAAKVVTIDIYYWKDMFLGRKISDFVVTGPYKYFSNPMYGIGQIPAYAVAIWYGSAYGLSIAFINQVLIFTFYFLVEKKFIKRVYQHVG